MSSHDKSNIGIQTLSLGIVGVRGYVGRELISLIAHQPQLKLAWVSSRQLEGKKLTELLQVDQNFSSPSLDIEHYYHQLTIDNFSSNAVAEMQTDIVVLALPNGLAKEFVSKLEQTKNYKVIIDLSADYRFDDSWIYSVPEINQMKKNEALQVNNGLIKISNPGCYATAMQVAIAPLLGSIKGRVNCFGISGYSGAGTTPSANNDPENLKDNILPYGLVEHLHEREVTHQLNQPVWFSPHVASFFRGISLTIQLELTEKFSESEILQTFQKFYKNQKYLKVQPSIPNIRQVNHTPFAYVGGFKLSNDGQRLTIVSCLDNLLKGAASQALQNIALACQLDIDILGVRP